MLTARVLDDQAQHELDEDMQAWGMEASPEPDPEPFEVWDEHREALLWWCQGGAQLTFNGPVCTGLNVVAVEADARPQWPHPKTRRLPTPAGHCPTGDPVD